MISPQPLAAQHGTGFSTANLLATVLGLPRPTRYWVAFSGGMDSTCLLHALARLRDHLPAPVCALHVDHGLQTESARWQAHCARMCDELGIEFAAKSLGLQPLPGASIEDVARQGRLAVYRSILGPNELILTAQHRDDQAETLLLQLLRGAGLPGLAAMPHLMPCGKGWLARPLLEISRAQLYAYAQIHGLNWVEDPSNADVRFERNYLRHHIMPLLTQRWPACTATIARSAGHCAEAMDLLTDTLARDVIAAQGSKPNTLSVTALRAIKPNLCRAILRHWLHAQNFSPPSSRLLERIRLELLTAAPDRKPLVKWPGVEIRRYRDDIFALRPLPPLPTASVIWQQGAICCLPSGLGQVRCKPTATGIGLDPMWGEIGALEIHFGLTGVRCRVAGMGLQHSLKNLYQAHAIPSWIRPYVPLVYFQGKIISIAGLCVCEKLVTTAGIEFIWEGDLASIYHQLGSSIM